ncbi:MAG: pyridoxamine 5'-phosphate oxidase family protein [Acidimicrobiales bacterium]
MSTSTTTPATTVRPDPDRIAAIIASRSYAVVSTVSPAGVPHAAGVLYAVAGGSLYVSTMAASRKARNVAASGHAAMVVPVRRLPVGPPSAVQFQGRAEVLSAEDPELRRLADAGRLKSVTSHGELELEGGCFLRITPPSRITTYGLGLSLWRLIRDPLSGGGSVELPPGALG